MKAVSGMSTRKTASCARSAGLRTCVTTAVRAYRMATSEVTSISVSFSGGSGACVVGAAVVGAMLELDCTKSFSTSILVKDILGVVRESRVKINYLLQCNFVFLIVVKNI